VTLVSPARWAALIGPAAYASDTDRVVTGYALTGGIQRWFLLPETRVRVIGTRGSDAHVKLDSVQTIRIAQSDLRMLDSTASRPPLRASAMRIVNAAEWTDVVIPINGPPAYYVEQRPDSLMLTLYGTTSSRRQQTLRGAARS
jgi:hypothetical protein